MSLKLRRLVFEAWLMSDMLPTFNVLPGFIFNRCITMGMLNAASAKNHIGDKNCIAPPKSSPEGGTLKMFDNIYDYSC